MKELIFYLLIGLGLGSLYAMLGAGLVIVYRGSGVINFAQGAFAMYGVFTFDEARNRGHLHLPWVDFLPTHSVNLPVAIKLADDGSWPKMACVGHRAADGRAARADRALPRVPPAAASRPRSARSSPRSA